MESSKSRKAVVAGQFYPSTAGAIKKQIESFLDTNTKKTDAIACMLPHAGYVYSGVVAVETVSRVKIKDNIVLLGPNHTGFGSNYSIMTEGSWQTPMGELNIDSDLAGRILKNSRHLKDDLLAHAYEHSLEVELPILQYFRQDFKFVPITFLSDDLSALKEVGTAIANAIIESGIKDSTMIIASSDMTHYESQGSAEKKDREAIKAILELDEDKLLAKIRSLDITMCGYAPVITMISAAKLLGAKRAELVDYRTSGDITQDMDSVVGYAGIVLY